MLDRVQNWLTQPFKKDMNAWDWALFVLFLIVIAFLWLRVLNLITREL